VEEKAEKTELKPVKVRGIEIPMYRYKDGRTAFADTFGGERKMRVFKDAGKAYDEAEALAIRLLNGEALRSEFKATDQAIYKHALQLVEKVGIPLTAALEEYVAAKELCKGRPLLDVVRAGATRANLEPKLVADVVQEFLAVKTADEIDVHYHKQITQLLGQLVKRYPDLTIQEITAKQIKEHYIAIAAPRANGKKGAGYKRRKAARGAIVSLFRYARDIGGYLIPDVRTEAEKVDVPGKEINTIATHTPDELRFWLRVVRLEYLPWMAITNFSGVRTEEVCPKPDSRKDRLRWEDINFTKDVIIIRPEVSKTGVKRIIPLLPNLKAWLMPWVGRSGPVMPSPMNIRYETKLMNKASAKLDIDHAKGTRIHPHPGLRWKQNANRHSYGSHRNAIIQNSAQLAEEMGNSVGVIKRDYEDPKEREVADAFFGIMPTNVGDNVIQVMFAMG
jgi:integrase